jgi:hypothetical protein
VQPDTIVLLSPDHFFTNQLPLEATRRTWKTLVRDIEADSDLIAALGLPVTERGFLDEHGVTAILGDIARAFPTARIVPIKIASDSTFSDMAGFVEALHARCPTCLLMASVDFSHATTAAVAALHDRLTLRELSSRDAVSLYTKAEVDSPASLAALALWATRHEAERFTLFSHTNSGHLAGTVVGEMTTHIIGSYGPGAKTTDYSDEVTLQFGGDIIFTSPTANPFLSLGERLFWGVDIALANLEGVIAPTDTFSVRRGDGAAILTYPPIVAEWLRSSRIGVLNLGNNHQYDGDERVRTNTRTLLVAAGMQVLGTTAEDVAVLRKVEGDTRVAVVVGTTEDLNEEALLLKRVSEETAAGYDVIAYVHWGKEFNQTPTPAQHILAKRLVAAGARLIVGTHPHVVIPAEVIDGVPVLYSLGNLAYGDPERVETHRGAVLGVRVRKGEWWFDVTPVQSYPDAKVVGNPEFTSLRSLWTEAWRESATATGEFYFTR